MNIPNAILSLQSRDLQKLSDDKAIDGFRFMELNKLITEFCDDMGRSERIRNTVFPTTYTYYSKNFIWIFIYAVTMAIGSAIGMWAIVFGTITGYIFFTIQSLGQTLVNPFERSPSALPLDQITRTIEINLLQMLGEKEIPKPVESVNGEYIL
jgi:putative membrane protein